MTSITVPTRFTAPIALWSPPHRRLFDAMGNWIARWVAERERARQERAAVRQARRRHAALSKLDARTLRDVGLGDWAAHAADEGVANFRREVELRGFF